MGVWSRLDLDDTARIGVGEMTYYINNKGDIAKVLGVDDRTGLASVVINDKPTTMAWNEFIKEFNGIKK